MICSTKLADTVESYCDGVLDGTIPTGRLVRLAVERHRLDLRRTDVHFDPQPAEKTAAYFGLLRMTTGEYAGRPFELRQWQCFLIWCLFGWRRADGTRRFRDATISVARGNGKSPLAAALAVKLAFLDGEPRAEAYCFATKKDQAKIVFEEAQRLVEMQPDLCKALQSRVGAIINTSNYSALKPLGSDSKNTDGLVPHCCVLDEMHEWRQQHRGLWDKIETSMGKRRQALLLKISTAGTEYSDIWREQYEYSRQVLEQVINPPETWIGDDHFAYIAEIDEEDDVFDEANWPKSNPMLREPDSPVKIDHLRKVAQKAQAGDIFSEARFRRYFANQWTSSSQRVFTPEVWALGNSEIPDSDGVCYAGLDLARSDDFAAVTLVQLLDEYDPRQYSVRTWAWTVERGGSVLEQNLELARIRRECDNLFVLPGSQVEFSVIREFCAELEQRFTIDAWLYDKWMARETAQILVDEHNLNMVVFPQKPSQYHEPVIRFRQELLAGRVRHGSDRLLRWQAFNVTTYESPHGHVMPDKRRQERKIDSIIAMLMAFGQAIAAPATPRHDYYATHKVESF